MCTVTLSYDPNSTSALEQLSALLKTGQFIADESTRERLHITGLYKTDYTDSIEGKEFYTPEDLRNMLIADLNEIYGK